MNNINNNSGDYYALPLSSNTTHQFQTTLPVKNDPRCLAGWCSLPLCMIYLWKVFIRGVSSTDVSAIIRLIVALATVTSTVGAVYGIFVTFVPASRRIITKYHTNKPILAPRSVMRFNNALLLLVALNALIQLTMGILITLYAIFMFIDEFSSKLYVLSGLCQVMFALFTFFVAFLYIRCIIQQWESRNEYDRFFQCHNELDDLRNNELF